jgi:hypothetical protein
MDEGKSPTSLTCGAARADPRRIGATVMEARADARRTAADREIVLYCT